MLRFTAYIEYLLMTRHYCYVPGHGAYMLSDEVSVADSVPSIGPGSRRFQQLAAPSRTVRFSPLHSHDDGVLANLLMEAEGMTYDEACRYIARQAPLLTDDFVQQACADTDTENFGFASLQVETWHDIEARLTPAAPVAAASDEPKASDRDAITIPRVWLQRAAMVALVIIFFFTNFIGLHNGDAQLASVIDVQALQRNAQMLNSLSAAYDEDEDEDVSHDVVLADANVTTSSATPVAPVPVVTTASAAGKQYYIIIASSRSESEAMAVCRRYADQEGFERIGILAKDNLFRVYTAVFDQQASAIQYLRQLRQLNPRFEKSWMLPLEGDKSLSYIIKDIYNDNQLSMELSHPNPRTERDQG